VGQVHDALLEIELHVKKTGGVGDLENDLEDDPSDYNLPAKLALLWRDYKRANYERYGAEVRGDVCAWVRAHRADASHAQDDEDDDNFGQLTLSAAAITQVFDKARAVGIERRYCA
jgi:hypothetical protein